MRLLSPSFLCIIADAALPRLVETERYTPIDSMDLRGDPSRKIALAMEATAASEAMDTFDLAGPVSAGVPPSGRGAPGAVTTTQSPAVLLLSFVHSCAIEAAVADVAAERIHDLEDAHATMVYSTGSLSPSTSLSLWSEHAMGADTDVAGAPSAK